jgi:hypothetical protein
MSAKAKVSRKSHDEIEVDKFNDSVVEYELMRTEIDELKFLNEALDKDLKIARGLLQESVAQLGKTNDEYHSDLRDKIVKEIGE